jgi:hypothetical protein
MFQFKTPLMAMATSWRSRFHTRQGRGAAGPI